jgi:hypothetical protein
MLHNVKDWGGKTLPVRRILMMLLLTMLPGTACSPQHSGLTGPPRQPAAAGLQSAQELAPGLIPLPRVNLTLSDRAAWREILKWPEDCETAFEQSRPSDDPGLGFHRLADGLSLVEVLCAAGAYQPSFRYFRLDESPPRPTARALSLPTYESADGTTLARALTTEVWGEPVFLPKTRQLIILSLARQTGDCGTWARYAFPAGEPRLEEMRARYPCPEPPEEPVQTATRQPPPGWRLIEGE